ncbi:MAG: hypothetical protein J6Y43_00585 [Clostridia bacterium]|nr:hypothetical protein [Clostridia bacterium]
MRIKQIDIDGKKLCFSKSDNLIFIKDNANIFDWEFIDAIKAIFCDTKINANCVCLNNRNIKCVLEIYGTDFTVTVKVVENKFPKKQNVFGTKGSFEVSCKSDFDSSTFDNNRLKRLCECDFREMFMPIDTTREIVFYDRDAGNMGFTNGLITYYRDLLKWTKDRKSDMENEDKFSAVIESQCAAMEKFIDEFNDIDLGFCSIGFDKNTCELQLPDSENDTELNIINFCDFITANKLNTVIEHARGNDGDIPVFVIDIFRNIGKDETEFYIDELWKLKRQVFIIENGSNPLLEKRCDKTISMEDNND